MGFGAWSSQRSAFAAIEGRLGADGSFSAGITRIDVRMRCGVVLPFVYRVGFFQDVSLDGKVDATDGKCSSSLRRSPLALVKSQRGCAAGAVIVWNRRQFPEAHTIYKTHLIVK